MRLGPILSRDVPALVVRSWVRGEWATPVLASMTLLGGGAIGLSVRPDLGEVAYVLPPILLAACACIVLCLQLLHRHAFVRPASPAAIKNLLRLERQAVIKEVAEKYIRSGEINPSQAVPISLIDIWVRAAAQRVATERNAALDTIVSGQERAFALAIREH